MTKLLGSGTLMVSLIQSSQADGLRRTRFPGRCKLLNELLQMIMVSVAPMGILTSAGSVCRDRKTQARA